MFYIHQAGLMTKREMEKLEVLHNETEEGNRQVTLSETILFLLYKE